MDSKPEAEEEEARTEAKAIRGGSPKGHLTLLQALFLAAFPTGLLPPRFHWDSFLAIFTSHVGSAESDGTS